MTPWRARGVAAALVAAVLTARALEASGGAPGGEVILPLTVNGEAKGDVRAWISGAEVFVLAADLDRLGIPGAAQGDSTPVGARVPLSSLGPDVTYRFDEERVLLELKVGRFRPGALSVLDFRRGVRPDGIVYTTDPSGFVNYSATWSASGVGAFAEAGFSFGKGLLTTTASRGADGRIARGLSQLVLDDREHLIRTTAGDAFASTGGLLGGGTFLGGVSVSRTFDLDPYFVRYPGVGLSGAALSPSKLDVYVNGSLVQQLEVPAGPFDLRNLPVTAGGGDTRLVLRDALGQEREVSSSYYVSTRTLAEGLSEFQYAAGVRRSAPGTPPEYSGGLAFLGSHRLGLTDNLTAGARLEAARGLVSGGTTFTASLPIGDVEVSAAGSRADGAAGWAASAAWSYQRRPLGAGVLFVARSDAYSTLSLSKDQDRLASEATLFGTWSGIKSVGISASVGRLLYRDGGRADRFGASATVRLTADLNLYASAARTGGKSSAALGLTLSLGGGASASVSYQKGDGFSGLTADAQQALPRGDGFGYRVHADSRDVLARAQLQEPWGRAELSASGGRPAVGVNGGLAVVGGSFNLTRPIEGGFALIRVPGSAGVRGTESNQVVGRTNAKGDLLVTDLLPYYGNVLGIEDSDLPLDYDVQETRRVVAPPYRGGALVTFEARRASAVFGTILLDDGSATKAPARGLVRLLDSAGESPVGMRGEFFFETLEPGPHRAEVVYRGIPCRFTFTVPPATERRAGITKVGEVRCQVPYLLETPGAPPRAGLTAPSPAPPPTLAAVGPTSPADSCASASFAVHLGSYRSRGTAEREMARLASLLGRPGCVRSANLGGKGVWYRVYVGRFASRREAAAFRETLLARSVTAVGEVALVDQAS